MVHGSGILWRQTNTAHKISGNVLCPPLVCAPVQAASDMLTVKTLIKNSNLVVLFQVDGDEASATRKATVEFSSDIPVDLASLYAKKGGVDLSTLSELTRSVGMSEEGEENTRTKRTCVRVREGISKLQEIFNDDSVDTKPARVGGRGRGRGGAHASAATVNLLAEVVSDERMSCGSGLAPLTKKKRSSYSQFTHKRRKKRKRSPDEG